MLVERIKSCPCCIEKGIASVDIFAERKDNGDIQGLYVFGDDDFSLSRNNSVIKDIVLSQDEKLIIGLICPSCEELVNVNIPIIKDVMSNAKKQDTQENVNQRAM